MEGRHVGLDFYDLLIEVKLRFSDSWLTAATLFSDCGHASKSKSGRWQQLGDNIATRAEATTDCHLCGYGV